MKAEKESEIKRISGTRKRT